MVNDRGVDINAASPRLSVFFDGACPLCTREIALYRQCRGADDLAWVDISKTGEEQITPGLCRADAAKRFHVMHPDGRITSGGQAFADLWTSLPALAWIGRIMGRWPLSVVLELAYRAFLPVRPGLQRLLRSRA